MTISEKTKQRSNGHRPVEKETIRPLRVTIEPKPYSRPLLYSSLTVGALAATAAIAGLVWRDIYANDPVAIAASSFSSDLVMLFLALPLLMLSLRAYVRGSMVGQMLVLGTLGYCFYYGTTYALGGVAFNDLFLLYVALFSASLFSLMVSFMVVGEGPLMVRLTGAVPRNWPGIFMIASGLVTLGIWVVEPMGSLFSGHAPESLRTHTTLFTNAFDLAIIVPAAIAAGVLILRRRPLGYVVAFALLVIQAMMLPATVIATLRRDQLGVSFTAGEFAGRIAGCVVFGLLAIWVLVALLRPIATDRTTSR